MAKVRFDMVAESSSSTGTGNITLTGALNPARTFATAGVATSDTFKYLIRHVSNNEWEVGTGTLLTSTTFSRSVLFSSNANALVNFSAGGLQVELTTDSADLAAMEADASTTVVGNVELATTAEQLAGTDAVRACTPDSVAALWERGADNSGGATITLGDGYFFELITSTTTITAFAFTTDKAGRMALVRFNTSRSVTHNATSLISPTEGAGASMAFNAGDVMLIMSLGSGNFRIITWWRRDIIQNNGGLTALVANATATNATTNLSCGTFSIPANMLRVGSVLRFTAYAVYVHTAASSPTLTVEILYGGSVIETLVVTPTSTAATYSVRLEGLLTVRTIGSTGTCFVSIWCVTTAGSNATNQMGASTGTATDTINTTTTNTVEMRVRMTTAVASNTLTVTQGIIEKVN